MSLRRQITSLLIAMTVALARTPREAVAAAVMSFPVVLGDVDR